VYSKLSDDLWRHPKTFKLGNEAIGVFCRLVSYCGNELSDGEVPDDVFRMVAKGENADAILEALKNAGWIRQRSNGDWLLPNYLEHNLSREEWLAQKEKDRLRQERKRRRERAERESREESGAESRRKSDRTEDGR
jgi:hypothetical protein